MFDLDLVEQPSILDFQYASMTQQTFQEIISYLNRWRTTTLEKYERLLDITVAFKETREGEHTIWTFSGEIILNLGESKSYSITMSN